MTRWKAAGIHLVIGFLLISTIVGSIFYFWFPHALHRIAGLNQIFVTMLCVDLVAGPLLTCIVYKVGDKRTRGDLAVIGVLQAGFLGYALHTIWITRPVFLIWSIDHMTLLFANDLEPSHVTQGTYPGTNSLSWLGPRLYAVALPEEPKEKEKIFRSLITERTDLDHLPKYYGPYEIAREKLLRQAATIAQVTDAPAQRDPRLTAAIAATRRPENRLRLVAIESSRNASFMLIDAITGEPLETLSPGTIGPATPPAD